MFRKGFTLLEILIVIALMVIIATIVIVSFTDLRHSQALDRDTETIVEILRFARTKTLSSQNASVYGVHFDSAVATLFTGASYASGTESNEVQSFTGSTIAVTLAGGGTDVVFSRLSGETASSGTIVVTSPISSKTRTITIYKTGLVELN